MPLSRRQLLGRLGAGLLTAPLWSSLLPRSARADTPAVRRLLLFATPNGIVPDRFFPQGGERSFSFAADSALAPLADRTADLTLVRGLEFHNANNHEGGQAAMLTNLGGPGTETGGRSLDQLLAASIGQDSRFPSLELGVMTSVWGGSQQTRMSYAGPGQFVHPDDDPLHVYQRLFGDVAGGADEAARIRSLRGSVLDRLSMEINDLHRRVGAPERARLEQHLASIRHLERGLDELPAATCETPRAPDLAGGYGNDDFPAIGRAQMELAAQALACGLTRVVSLQWSHTISPIVFTWLGHNQHHHSLSHSSGNSGAGVEAYIAAEQWYAERFAELLADLESRPDPEGPGSLLDHTLVVWCREMGDGRMHVCRDIPWVLAGATDWLDHGRYFDPGATNHAHLLVSIAQAFGLPLTTFGDPAAGQGPLAGLA